MPISRLKQILTVLNQVIRGKESVVELALATLLARGHLLLEDLPGTGKTTLALALARVLGCSFTRIQFTNDLLPADILGTEIYIPDRNSFEVRPGPIFTHVFLADEINRATPRTQSALLEAMGENRVSLGGQTFDLPAPFFVIATQNPLDLAGTYPLPESQLDRFTMRLELGYVHPEEEFFILAHDGHYEKAKEVPQILDPEGVLKAQKAVKAVHLAPKIYEYILSIGQASRQESTFRFGLSTRGLLALKRAAQALAYLNGRDYVIPDDVKRAFLPVAYYRLPSREEITPQEHVQCLLLFLADIPVPI